MALGNPGKHYPRAPITEAVIELRFTEELPKPEVEKLTNRLRDLYPNFQTVPQIDFNLDVDGAGKAKAQVRHHPIFRLASSDQTQIALFGPTTFTISQLAPYPDWSVFSGRFLRDFKEWKSTFGYRKISRVGVRYINRIDIPNKGETFRVEDWIRFTIDTPNELGPVSHFAAHAVVQLPSLRGAMILNSAHVPSPLVDHVSVVLDIDVIREDEPPQNDKALFDLLDQMRNAKNAAFEACVTDAARRLFEI